MMRVARDQSSYQAGLICGTIESISVSLAGGVFGFIFGMIASIQGLNILQIGLMSSTVYAGVLQVVSLSILTTHPITMIPLIITVIAVCSRYFLMGFSLNPHFKRISKTQLLSSLFLLMDENWAMTIVKARAKKYSNQFLFGYYLGGGILAYVVWVSGTILGVVLSGFFPNPMALGIDFAFTALFIALLVQTWHGKKELLPWIITFIAAIFTKKILIGSWYLIISALIGSVSAVMMEAFIKLKKN